MNDAFTTPWAIEEKSLSALIAQADRLNIEAATPGQVRRRSANMTEQNKIAVIQIRGPLFTHHNFFVDLLGGSVLDDLNADFRAAVGDKTIKGILLSIDSGGGQVNGIAELSRTIREARSKKPIAAHISGSGASGAYWIASAASRIFASETAILGSIGVVSSYLDRSKADEMAGIRRIEVVSSQSPDKRLVPTDDRGLAAEQELVDSLAAVFVRQVAENRGVSEEKVLSDFGQGGVKVGAAAVQAGLADGISTFEDTLSSLAGGKLPEVQKQTRKADFYAHGCGPPEGPGVHQERGHTCRCQGKPGKPRGVYQAGQRAGRAPDHQPGKCREQGKPVVREFGYIAPGKPGVDAGSGVTCGSQAGTRSLPALHGKRPGRVAGHQHTRDKTHKRRIKK